jgi:septation ring formation regulator EzrA
MEDATILGRIHELVDEEHRLRQQLTQGEISTDEEHTRLRELEEALDQCWDLLRRRRAARKQGADPDSVEPRDKQQVESYLQ